MQPVQLSLLPEAGPTPVPRVVESLPEPVAAEAIQVLATLIAKALHAGEEINDE